MRKVEEIRSLQSEKTPSDDVTLKLRYPYALVSQHQRQRNILGRGTVRSKAQRQQKDWHVWAAEGRESKGKSSMI